ncbi:MAG: WecB/TagA/CpsF family glycosyltransferase [Methylococcaceae bacterium]|nr:WecB/TagA/CpsF family glycosyltransferase [Methylococcaceae bacterium]
MRKPGDLPGPLGKSSRFRRSWRWRRFWQPIAILLAELLPRLFDLILALVLLFLLAPFMAIRAVLARWRTGQVIMVSDRVGRLRSPFKLLSFADNALGRRLPVLFNIFAGNMAFAGPRPLTPEEARALRPEDSIRFCIRPGLFSPHTVRHKTGIAYDDEGELDREFYYGESTRGNAGLVARGTISSLLAGGGLREMPEQFSLLGVRIINTTMSEAIDWIIHRCRGTTSNLAAFVNPDCLNVAYKNSVYHDVLTNAACVWPDGIGINVGCRMLGLSLRENVNGTDMFPRLCERAARENISLYLLGARPDIARLAAENMRFKFPELRIAGYRDGYFSQEDEAQVIHDINQSGADVLLVAFGAPKQEVWLAGRQHELKPRVLIGVGGLFDFYSGRIPRAPVWMREIGLEWTWRLMQEPGRMWRRYVIGNPLFLFRVYRQKLAEHSA